MSLALQLGQPLYLLTEYRQRIETLELSLNGNIPFICSTDSQVKAWDIAQLVGKKTEDRQCTVKASSKIIALIDDSPSILIQNVLASS